MTAKWFHTNLNGAFQSAGRHLGEAGLVASNTFLPSFPFTDARPQTIVARLRRSIRRHDGHPTAGQ